MDVTGRLTKQNGNPRLKDLHPLAKPSTEMPGDMLAWANGSTLHGVPSGADQIRQYHPTIVIFDEAAHLDEFAESYGAAEPVASQIIAVSSAAPSWFGDVCRQRWRSNGSIILRLMVTDLGEVKRWLIGVWGQS